MLNPETILVTGGAGFIGSALVRYLINSTNCRVINVDKLTYSSNLKSLEICANSERYFFEKIDICDTNAVKRVVKKYQPDCIMHLAAESHVDRSIDSSAEFIRTNILGTHILLEQARSYWQGLSVDEQQNFRFHHISTDEVYGDLSHSNTHLDLKSSLFTEQTAYSPNSPYSASKASSDHLVRAWHRTYGLPMLISNCSNNYGPYQFPEKLIPLVILNILEEKPLPVYGDGQQIRDWLYVEDHVEALFTVLTKGKIGQTYNIGGHNEKTNLNVIHSIIDVIEKLTKKNKNYRDLIEFVEDRPGHDRRYAIDATKIKNELGWFPKETFETGIKKTVRWYLDNNAWYHDARNGTYQRQRLGQL